MRAESAKTSRPGIRLGASVALALMLSGVAAWAQEQAPTGTLPAAPPPPHEQAPTGTQPPAAAPSPQVPSPPETQPAAAAPAETQPAAPVPEQRFYFFSPDWRPGDLNTLTERVHAALLDQGLAVTFQAFARYDDFSKQVADLPPSFLLAPGWFQATAASDMGLMLQPIATPLRHQRATYRKALITRSGVGSIADLTRGSIAAAVYSLGPGSELAVLNALHLDAGSAKVVAVPKDLDGLLALGFGQVDAALVTAQQYDLLVASNPDAAARLQVLAFSAPIPLPGVFADSHTSVQDRARMAAALARLSQAEAGREVLGLLGYDAFDALEKPEQEMQPEPTAQARAQAAQVANASASHAPAVHPGARHRKKAK